MWEGPQSVWTLGGITGSQRRNSIHWRLSPFSLLLALGETSFQMFPAQQLEESLFQLGCSDKCTLCGNLRISPLKVFPFHCSTGVWWFCFCFCFCLFCAWHVRSTRDQTRAPVVEVLEMQSLNHHTAREVLECAFFFFHIKMPWFILTSKEKRDFPGGPVVKNSPAMQGTWVLSLVQEGPICQLSLCATATEPTCCNCWSPRPLGPCCATTEATPVRRPSTATRE